MPPSSATMRGIAGPTIVWLIDATNMPTIRPWNTRRLAGLSLKVTRSAAEVSTLALLTSGHTTTSDFGSEPKDQIDSRIASVRSLLGDAAPELPLLPAQPAQGSLRLHGIHSNEKRPGCRPVNARIAPGARPPPTAV